MKRVLFVLGILFSLIINSFAQEAKKADAGESPNAKDWVIYQPSTGHSAYKTAAEELAKYIKGMTGVNIPIKTDKDTLTGKFRFIIGGSDVNKIAKDLTTKGLLSISADLGDGYIVKSINSVESTNIVFAGLRPRGTLYAVYGYLRKQCECGFFRDGEFVPKKTVIPVKGINIIDKPAFPYREVFAFSFHYGPMAKYSSMWTWEYWKLWIDHSVKTGANTYGFCYYPGTFMAGEVFYKAFPECDPKNEKGMVYSPKYQMELTKKVLDYIRSMDMDTWYGVSLGGVQNSYLTAHPDLNYASKGSAPGFHGQASTISVKDPVFETAMTKLWSEFIKEFGKADYYFLQYAHEQRSDERYDAYDAGVKVFKKIDPKAKFIFWTWDLDWSPEIKDPVEREKMFNARLPKDAFIMDQYVSRTHGIGAKKPFEGRKWYHVNRFGEFLHGDRLAKGIGFRGKAIIPEALGAYNSISENCQGNNFYDELDFGNFLALQLARDCAWNSKIAAEAFNSGEWVKRYALERYGSVSVENMAASIKKSFEVEINGTLGIHPGENKDNKGETKDVLQRARKANDIVVEAIKLALKEKDKQAGNQLYTIYLYDLTTQWLMDLGYYKYLLASTAVKADPKTSKKQLDNFKIYIEMLKDIMASQDRDKLGITVDNVLAADPKADYRNFERMIGRWHYFVISYDKWYVDFYMAGKNIIANLENNGTGTAIKKPEPWWMFNAYKSYKEFGTYKPKKGTIELIEDAFSKGVFDLEE
ncbi:MAG: hypothetical protein A2452_11635 [Candidatus Firestonebacteria bacterium RIFOXYC2_FULL_39_67]|nr:MAG: hypothetical protein A2536_07675 [Candidatus Firestonebacteria bacterium RIFOXYD2_FULL_39_29]OGF53874.1 MAG: hypothetical protein A2452_11635 [Candidatus Firestonebacteria bacterium RIFOXYC2_FULL_39_67]